MGKYHVYGDIVMGLEVGLLLTSWAPGP